MGRLLAASLCSLVALGPLGSALPVGQETSGLEGVSLDELIAALPDLERQWVANRGGPLELRPPAQELARRLGAGVQLTAEQWVRALETSGALKGRGRWPVVRSYAVHLRVPAWLGLSQIRLYTPGSPFVVARAGSLQRGWRTCMSELWGVAEAESYQELGYLPEGTHTLAFRIEVERGIQLDFFGDETADPLAGRMLWKGTWEKEVRVVPTGDAALEVRSGSRADRAVRESLGLAWVPWSSNGAPVRRLALVVYSTPEESPGILGSCALSLDVTVGVSGQIYDDPWCSYPRSLL